ncbi:glycosyltransferase, partial [bacterium]|nr:glycosyltransferase [bacterium]
FIWVGELSPEVKIWCEHDLAQLENKQRVHLVGFQKEVANYMAAGALFVLTSREDPFPNVMLSAMEAGMPVVAFDKSGGAAELLADNQGVLVPFLDVTAMADEIVSLLRNPEKRQRIGQKASALIAKNYQFDDYVAFLLKQFKIPSPVKVRFNSF